MATAAARSSLFLFLASMGWAFAQPIGYDGARHLVSRTAFGVTEAEVRALENLTRHEAVDRILAGTRREATLAAPAFVGEAPVPYYKLRSMGEDERRAYQRRNFEHGLELREWWLREMLMTPSPLTERMTLFWHGHFATSQQKVRSGELMYRQNVLLRREAVGNFSALLHQIARDPAMLVYLDNAGSRRKAPNENFAREVMELFTLGEGQYSERDIKEVARAFTGWSLDRDTLEFTHRRGWHDGGEKSVFGKTGRFDGDAVLDLMLARPQAAEFITAKLWREFVSPTPDVAEVRRLAAVFRESRYDIKALLRALLVADAFWSPGHRANLIRSPVELVVGTLKTFDILPYSLRPAVLAAALLGQNPMSPPNVKGWPGGDAWINSATLLGRKQFLERLFRGADPVAAGAPAAMAEQGQEAASPERRFRRMMERGLQTFAFDWERWSRPADVGRLVLATSPINPVAAGTEGVALVSHLTSDPAYQLK